MLEVLEVVEVLDVLWAAGSVSDFASSDAEGSLAPAFIQAVIRAISVGLSELPVIGMGLPQVGLAPSFSIR